MRTIKCLILLAVLSGSIWAESFDFADFAKSQFIYCCQELQGQSVMSGRLKHHSTNNELLDDGLSFDVDAYWITPRITRKAMDDNSVWFNMTSPYHQMVAKALQEDQEVILISMKNSACFVDVIPKRWFENAAQEAGRLLAEKYGVMDEIFQKRLMDSAFRGEVLKLTMEAMAEELGRENRVLMVKNFMIMNMQLIFNGADDKWYFISGLSPLLEQRPSMFSFSKKTFKLGDKWWFQAHGTEVTTLLRLDDFPLLLNDAEKYSHCFPVDEWFYNYGNSLQFQQLMASHFERIEKNWQPPKNYDVAVERALFMTSEDLEGYSFAELAAIFEAFKKFKRVAEKIRKSPKKAKIEYFTENPEGLARFKRSLEKVEQVKILPNPLADLKSH